MDILYFKTNNKLSLLNELEIPYSEKSGEIILENDFHFSDNDWYLIWLGKDVKDNEYFLFNIHLNGQDNMDFFTQKLKNAELLIEPTTPKYKIL